jgi:hypothetical protein
MENQLDLSPVDILKKGKNRQDRPHSAEFRFPGGHGFPAHAREVAYVWFDRWLKPER